MKNLSTDFFKSYTKVILMIMILFIVLIEVFLREFIVTIPKSIPKIINQTVYKKHNKPVVIGDSHFYRGFVSSDQVISLSKGGLTIPIFLILVEQMPLSDIETIIIEASPQLFSKRHLEWGDRGFSGYFNPIAKWLRLKLFEPGITEYLGSINNHQTLIRILQKAWPDDRNKKSSWEKFEEIKRKALTRERVELHRPELENVKYDAYQKLYRSLIMKAIDAGVQICMIRTPVDSYYLSLIEKDYSYIESIDFFKELAFEFQLKYIDFQELDMTFDLESFINQDHITPMASIDFSALVLKECK